MATFTLFCAGAPELTDLMSDEAAKQGAGRISESGAGIECVGSLETAYRLCLWSRVMSRVQIELVSGEVDSAQSIYELARVVDWTEHLHLENTFSVQATSVASRVAPNNLAALKIKDAIADCFRDRTKSRPSVDGHSPDAVIHLHVRRNQARINFDLSGESLHRRGYRLSGTDAMLKETVAAAILLRAGWDKMAPTGAPLVDPMCGSGTVPIEAALIAGDSAPGLKRSFGFHAWKHHDRDLWERLLEEANERLRVGRSRLPPMFGFDVDPGAIRASRENANRAGVGERITFRAQPLERLRSETSLGANGLVVLDPPYGERTGSRPELEGFYGSLGDTVKSALPGWSGALLALDRSLSRATGLWARRVNAIRNGSLRCSLALFDIRAVRESPQPDPLEDEYRTSFANRLKKNLRSLSSWRAEEGISCWRVYDADMPEFAVAIDLFENKWAHVQEYEPPESISPDRAGIRRRVVLETVPEVLGIEKSAIFLKSRARQRKGGQYERLDTARTFLEVREDGLSLLINLTDHLDAGLFLDHRTMRSIVRREAKGKRMLNLFSYTGSVSLFAAAGGATEVTSVDLSATYTKWAEENFRINGFYGNQYRFTRSEARRWLTSGSSLFDLIFVDPPTFSRSKSFSDTFQVQRDHSELIRQVSRRLAPGGTIYFSTNYRRFVLDTGLANEFVVDEITEQTIPVDFRRNKRIHRAFRFTTG